jgi:primosomal protein N' (replication factor Y) (superfamily II helicase)
MGTQRVELELEERLGGMFAGRGAENGAHPWLCRVDGDTMTSAKDYFDVLARFARGELRVLLGTQMISKGLDFPNVRLVGVISADTGLNMPDFRAHERTFQLVSQVAGRAGRGTQAGRVIVQTFEPLATPIVCAARHDFVGFATAELAARSAAGLPPATRMARVVCRDQELAKAESAAKGIAAAMAEVIERDGIGSDVSMVGPMPCPISRIGGFHRVAIEVTAGSRGVVQRVLQGVRRRGLLKSDARTAVDVDPIALL